MRRLSKWVLACGSAAAIVGITPVEAGPFSNIFRGQSAASETAGNTEVANAVGRALQGSGLSGKDIQIEVQNGTAVLKGQIADSAQKARATQIVASVPGVRAVDNQMTPMKATPAAPSGIQQAAFQGDRSANIQQIGFDTPMPPAPAPASAPKMSNQEVATAIAQSLSQNGLGGQKIQVRFKNGQATLQGDVSHPMEALKAQELAYANPAVQQVNNNLTANGMTPQQIMAQMQAQGGPQQAGYVPPMPQHGPIQQTAAQMGPAMQAPMAMPGGGAAPMYNGPNLPSHAWPTYAPYDNYAAVNYPSQYDASAFPYIGPFYPYPQVPMGWRESKLVWDDGTWNLKFNSRTDRWWWFLNPHNWSD